MAGRLTQELLNQLNGQEAGERSVTVTLKGACVGVLDRYRKGKSYREVAEMLILVAAEHLEEVRANRADEGEIGAGKESGER